MTVKVLGRRLPASKTYFVALSTALLLLVVTVSAALWQTNRGIELNREVRESLATRGELRLLLRGLQDSEIGQRGYLLTGNTIYLEPYLAAHDDVVVRMAALVERLGDDPAVLPELERMQELTASKLDELTLTVALYRAGRQNEAMLIVDSNRGKEVMDELRQLIHAAEEREDRLVRERTAEVDRTALILQLVIVFAGLLLVGIGALLVVIVRGALAELRESRDQAQAAHERAMHEMGKREQAEAKVRQMQKMEAIGQLTGGVAHDFNNMLAVIISALQLAQRRIARGETGIDRFIDSAMDGARRAATLTSRLLAFARRAPLTPTVFDPNRVISGMSELLRRTLGEAIEFETVLSGGLWRVNADIGELENAILNVCVNARDAMPHGGKLTIESANTYLDQTYADAAADVSPGQYVMIAITDTGGGMPPDVKAQAFEPFFTTKEVGKGTGLGLAHVHGFMKQSGGHVAIYSEMGVGTTVKLYLPRTQSAAEETTSPLPSAASEDLPAGDASTIILVVEDEERVRALSVASLRDLGYTVIHADHGAQALEVLAQQPGVSLLFTDIVMPGMSGRKLADEAKARYPALKVLYTTGYTRNAIVHNGAVDADARLLMKPYSISELARKVRAVLDE